MHLDSPALQALRAADRAESSQMGYAIIEHSRLIETDANLRRIFACPPGEDLSGRPVEDLALGEEAERLERFLRQAETGKNPILFAFRGRRRDGSAVELEVCAVRAARDGRAAVFLSFLDRGGWDPLRSTPWRLDSNYERVFDGSGLYLWNANLAPIWRRLQTLKAQGVGDIARHLREHRAEADELLSVMRFNSASEGARRLFKIDGRRGASGRLAPILNEQIAAIWDGRKHLHSEIHVSAADGKSLVVILSMQVPQSEAAAQHCAVALFDITERKAAEVRLAYLARFDSLTDLPNRATFVERLAESMARARRGGTGIAVHFLDLDQFKEVNDRLGHRAGDSVLRAVGQRLKKAVRETDTVARFGGDEFAVLQTDVADASGVDLLASKLIHVFAEPFFIEHRQLTISTSIGITVGPAPDRDPETMMGQADLALYRAKAEGRNRYKFHSEEMNQEVRARSALAEQMRGAVEAGGFLLHYRPQIDVPSGTLIGLEAHLRWPRGDREILPPSSFLRLAEETGLIVPLGGWALREACRQLLFWRQTGIAPPRLVVRVSSRQLGSETDFETTLRSALGASGTPATSLELELSESVLGDLERVSEDPIARLRRTGVGIAIEGFGTGSCSLGYVTSFRVSRLKIAHQFVHDILSNAAHVALVRAILRVAQEMGFEAIAEGVETKAQADLLATLGCRQMQGAYFGQPVPAEEIESILRARRFSAKG
jgi:diguanylate cyclase (GGDEF)-like protein